MRDRPGRCAGRPDQHELRAVPDERRVQEKFGRLGDADVGPELLAVGSEAVEVESRSRVAAIFPGRAENLARPDDRTGERVAREVGDRLLELLAPVRAQAFT